MWDVWDPPISILVSKPFKLIFSKVYLGLITIILNLLMYIKSKSLATSNKSTYWFSLIIKIFSVKLLILFLIMVKS